MASGTSLVADQKHRPASAFPLPQMGFPFANSSAVNIPVASRNNDEAFAEQLFDDLIDKALSHETYHGMYDHII